MRIRFNSQVTGIVLTLFLFSILFSLGTAAPAGAAAAGVPLTADEQQMAGLINQARNNAGIPSLTVDPTLSSLARTKALDMASNGYFSHTSPTYGSPFQMIKAAGITYTYAGENLAKASTVTYAFKALMVSSGHKGNILSKKYDRVGVGVATSGSYKIIVQMFTGGQKIGAPVQQPQPTPQPQPVPQPASEPQPQPAPQPQPDPVPQPAPDVQGLNADEQRMLDLVNAARAEAGLKPLQADMALVKLARLKAQDMINNNYFDHTSPTYGSPFDMMKAAGITYRYAGENLAGAPTVDTAHTNLMNSPGHRANILNANFTKVGIGVVNGGPYGKMFVQMFIG